MKKMRQVKIMYDEILQIRLGTLAYIQGPNSDGTQGFLYAEVSFSRTIILMTTMMSWRRDAQLRFDDSITRELLVALQSGRPCQLADAT
uniref:Uncharacterized protein n=1 Tax=Triticum urartu TaxID=4572 RepID=A0A8R7QN46_TRIUA